MNPAFSVIFLTTLIGAGQGLFLALVGTELAAEGGLAVRPDATYFAGGSAIAIALLVAGLAASFAHLGHPERAWRAAHMWRTSWLSREVIVLPAFIAAVAAYGAAHAGGLAGTAWIGAAGVLLCLLLFLCTAMIYACLRFLQEWHTPLTFVNFLLLGTASGTMLCAAWAAHAAPHLALPLAGCAAVLTAAGLGVRLAMLARNARLRSRSTLQSALGVKHPQIAQKSQGAMGGSFNTREFFHARSVATLRAVKWAFIVGAFVVPVGLAVLGMSTDRTALVGVAFCVQFAGLIAERWYFFAQARHPQNLYYQFIS